ncbi:hypothetical protein BJ875DRAFT_509441 [Amylocarpus encephaloides]|uniref:Uncharacterized protein n=1 Tax=Amylocarpus encephaloides TaxID=45428 RepID=A0A9P8C5S2_9HELO|nr:hypothetical protein BJ875DRAFT_509441 [Amylocarpus encephaloides]
MNSTTLTPMMARSWKLEQPPAATRHVGFLENRWEMSTSPPMSSSGRPCADNRHVLPRMDGEVVELFEQQGATIPNSRRHPRKVSSTSVQLIEFDGVSHNVPLSNSSSPSKVLHNRVEITDGSPRPSKMQKTSHEIPASCAAYRETTSSAATIEAACSNPRKRPDATNVIASQMIGSALGVQSPKKEKALCVGWETKSTKTESKKMDERVVPRGVAGTTKTARVLSPPKATSSPVHRCSEGRPETTDVVARRMIGAALGVAIPKRVDEKTVAVNKAMRCRRSDERLAAWDEYKGSKKSPRSLDPARLDDHGTHAFSEQAQHFDGAGDEHRGKMEWSTMASPCVVAFHWAAYDFTATFQHGGTFLALALAADENLGWSAVIRRRGQSRDD